MVVKIIWMTLLAKLLEELGLVEKDTKAIPTDTVVDCLGFLFDTMALTMSVTHNRLIEIKDLVKGWHQRTKTNKTTPDPH